MARDQFCQTVRLWKSSSAPVAALFFIYVNARSAQTKPVLKDFVDFYIEKAPMLVSSVGYVPYQLKATTSIMFTSTEAGTVFAGKPS